MAWLLRDGDVLAAVEVRRPGWKAASPLSVVVLRGPALVRPCTPSPASGRRRGLVRLDGEQWAGPGVVVRRISRRRRVPGRRPHPGAAALVVARAGTFERWRLEGATDSKIKGA